jgi:hypothetical protein
VATATGQRESRVLLTGQKFARLDVIIIISGLSVRVCFWRRWSTLDLVNVSFGFRLLIFTHLAASKFLTTKRLVRPWSD